MNFYPTVARPVRTSIAGFNEKLVVAAAVRFANVIPGTIAPVTRLKMLPFGSTSRLEPNPPPYPYPYPLNPPPKPVKVEFKFKEFNY